LKLPAKRTMIKEAATQVSRPTTIPNPNRIFSYQIKANGPNKKAHITRITDTTGISLLPI